jgi:hypothetical protein
MKTYIVKITSHYLDGGSKTESIRIEAYDARHAEERAWELLCGQFGYCCNMEFRATKAV